MNIEPHLIQLRNILCDVIKLDYINIDISSGLFRKQLGEDLADLVCLVKKRSEAPIILDLSCGKGIITSILEKQNIVTVGCDVILSASDQLAIDKTEWQTLFWNTLVGLSKNKLNRYFYYQTTRIGMLTESFDGICAYAVYEHIPPEFRTDWLQEVHRLLRPGGALLIAHCPRPESPTEQLARWLGIPAHEYLISTDSLVAHVESVGFAVEGVWLNDHIPSFLPWGPRWLRKAYLDAQDGPLNLVERFVGWVTRSRWAHHTNLIALKR